MLSSTAAGFLTAGSDSPHILRNQPQDGLPDAIDLRIAPEDTTLSAATRHLCGAAPANEPPQAVAVALDTSGSGVSTRVGRSVWLDWRGSSDPEGDPLRYTWTVVARPLGCTAQPETPAAQGTPICTSSRPG